MNTALTTWTARAEAAVLALLVAALPFAAAGFIANSF